MSSNVVPLRPRKPRASDIVERALADGKPLPLEVMLTEMWRLVDDASRYAASKDPDDAVMIRVTRASAVKLAIEAAPYIHAKQASTTISGDPESPLKIEAERGYRFDKLTDQRAAELLDSLQNGSITIEDVHNELA